MHTPQNARHRRYRLPLLRRPRPPRSPQPVCYGCAALQGRRMLTWSDDTAKPILGAGAEKSSELYASLDNRPVKLALPTRAATVQAYDVGIKSRSNKSERPGQERRVPSRRINWKWDTSGSVRLMPQIRRLHIPGRRHGRSRYPLVPWPHVQTRQHIKLTHVSAQFHNTSLIPASTRNNIKSSSWCTKQQLFSLHHSLLALSFPHLEVSY